MNTAVSSTQRYTSYASFFMYSSGVVAIGEQHFIGYGLNDKSDVFVKSLHCAVEVFEPDMYGFNLEPTLHIKWFVTYNNWSKSKREWGKREVKHEINKTYLNNIISLERQREIETEVVSRLQKKINNGITALTNYNKRENN